MWAKLSEWDLLIADYVITEIYAVKANSAWIPYDSFFYLFAAFAA